MKIYLITLAILVLVVSVQGQTPTPGNDSPDCHAARMWHLQTAMRYSEANDQEYHLGAADAAYMLAEYGPGYCTSWKQDASPPRVDPNTGEIKRGTEAAS